MKNSLLGAYILVVRIALEFYKCTNVSRNNLAQEVKFIPTILTTDT